MLSTIAVASHGYVANCIGTEFPQTPVYGRIAWHLALRQHLFHHACKLPVGKMCHGSDYSYCSKHGLCVESGAILAVVLCEFRLPLVLYDQHSAAIHTLVIVSLGQYVNVMELIKKLFG